MKTVNFQLCFEADGPTEKPDRVANIKHDGRRVAVIKEGDRVYFWGRDAIVDNHFPEIIEAFQKIPGNFIVDTEFTVFTNEVKTDRGLLQTRDRTKDRFKIKLLKAKYPATAVVFDLLEFNGQDLRNEEYQKRKKLLESNFQNNNVIKIAKDWPDPKEAWKFAQTNQLEGIIEKDIHSKYVGKRADTWIKIKRKEVVKKRFTGYEVSNAGITLTNPEGDRVACHGEQHILVKEAIDKKGWADIKLRSMAGITEKGRRREIVFFEFIE